MKKELLPGFSSSSVECGVQKSFADSPVKYPSSMLFRYRTHNSNQSKSFDTISEIYPTQSSTSQSSAYSEQVGFDRSRVQKGFANSPVKYPSSMLFKHNSQNSNQSKSSDTISEIHPTQSSTSQSSAYSEQVGFNLSSSPYIRCMSKTFYLALLVDS